MVLPPTSELCEYNFNESVTLVNVISTSGIFNFLCLSDHA